jgi:hypothetical protein
MKIPIELAPRNIQTYRQLAEKAMLRRMEALKKASQEQDVVRKRRFEKKAEKELAISHQFNVDADNLAVEAETAKMNGHCKGVGASRQG